MKVGACIKPVLILDTLHYTMMLNQNESHWDCVVWENFKNLKIMQNGISDSQVKLFKPKPCCIMPTLNSELH